MIERIIEYSIRNRFIVIIATLVLAALGIHAVINTPVDAIPDLSENQVIVFTDWMGRSPREIEDQITYPLSVNLQGLAGVKAVRSSSEFNFSMINIIFEENIDFYFARQRVLERLTLASTFLPPGVVPYLAPDATALGQIFWYTVEGEGYDLGRLRAIQDWYVRYQLNSVPGVAQVASVGGYPIEYQVDVDPNKLRAYGITLGDLFSALERANSAVGGRVIHKGNAEYLIRGVGWIGADEDPVKDIENTAVKTEPRRGTPIFISNVATVSLGTQFRRSVLEKDGNETVGGVAMMRYGENPLEVTRRIKRKIEQLQSGLPEGVRIVPFYDRTRLIQGAIHTLTEVLTHEMIIASVAVLLILMHFRSAFVICITLPLSVLISFILMRLFGIPSNIMSLAGIAISIGILVDQAIVMVENATHHLTAKFGKAKVRGDTRELVIPACRTVGRPIFFSVMIILISFLPVFSLHGIEGKTFHPLAFTKSFAMIGVAILSITLVPALIPTFIKGRIRSEEESWIVRTMINIYKPVLTWALPRWNLVLWAFAVLLILGAGLFPLQAIFGVEWRTGFLITWGLVTALTAVLMRGWWQQLLGVASLVLIGYWAYGLDKIGVEYMPPLDEGSILDMPITVPRASVTQVADDLKARDAVLRSFPEVEQVVGKAGRADTPTDPAPLDMIETVINLYPPGFWPKRHLRYEDAQRQALVVFRALEGRGFLKLSRAAFDRQPLVDAATMNALTRLDRTLRDFVLERDVELKQSLSGELPRVFVAELVRRWADSGRLRRPVAPGEVEALSTELSGRFGPRLAAGPAQEDVNLLIQAIAEKLSSSGAVEAGPELLAPTHGRFQKALGAVLEVLGTERRTLFTDLWRFIREERERRWTGRLRDLNRQVFDLAVGSYDWYCLEEIRQAAKKDGLWNVAEPDSPQALQQLRAELDVAFARRLFLWKKKKDDLVKEMGHAVQMPGWANIFTQPIINRIDMLATGVRTMIGVKVFGKDLNEIQRVSEEIAAVLRTVPGAADVVPDQSVGKGYVEINIDRRKAARYGVSVGDIQDVIEMALAGKAITMTVEGRERHPVRLRYARDFREDEEQIKNLLVSASTAGMAAAGAESPGMGLNGSPAGTAPAAARERPLQVPLKMVAEVKVLEGPGMIKSENGMLRSYVQLNVRDRDIVGFVEEAQRVVPQQVKLPPGMYLEWSGQFEHQIRARNTLKIVFPAVMALIFIILFLTYHDFVDALLMMMAVPEALVGGIFFLWLTGANFSVAVWVGFIACFGMATETGIIMLVYLREAIDRRGGLEGIRSLEELRQAVIEGAVHRLRPKLLTEGVAIVALAPMLWHSGVGHEVISAMAAPVLGGLLIADEVVDIFIPVRFYWVRRRRWLKIHGVEEGAGERPVGGPGPAAGGPASRPAWVSLVPVVLLPALLLVAGCSSAPPPASPPTGAPPAAVSATGVAPEGPRRAPESAPVAPADRPADAPDPFAGQAELSIHSLTGEVLKRNPSVAAAEAAWRAAEERYPQVTALEDPMVGFLVGPQSFGSNEVDTGWGVDASQKFPWPGKLRLRGSVARHEAEAALHEVEDTRLRLTEAAKVAFYGYFLVQREAEVTAGSIRAMQEFRNIARTRYEANQASRQDVLQAEVELAELEKRRVELEQQARVSVARINVLLHRVPDHPLPPPPAQLNADDPLPAVEDLRRLALERRPDLASQESRIRAEESGVELASREFYPDFEIKGGYDAFWQERELRASVGMNVIVPLQFGRRNAALREAKARVEQRRAELLQRIDQVQFEVQSGFERLRESRRVVEIYRQSIIPAAEQNVESARAGYVAGRIDFLRLIEAQRQLYGHQERQYIAVADYHRMVAELERVLAGPLPPGTPEK